MKERLIIQAAHELKKKKTDSMCVVIDTFGALTQTQKKAIVNEYSQLKPYKIESAGKEITSHITTVTLNFQNFNYDDAIKMLN